jgi:DNA/RNA-binding domain of Phe-tRNA-synthetase-like protein
MKLIISSEVAQKYPGLRIAFVVARGIRNGAVDAALEARSRQAEEQLRQRFPDPAALETLPPLVAWREIYRSFNVNPKKYRPSAEALIRRVVKGGALPSINLATNAYLLPQLEYLLPVGGYDLAQLDGDITLRFSPGQESFTPIGGDGPELTNQGEVVYADNAKVLTRCWNYRDCDQAKIVEQSRDVALFVEAARPELPTADIVALADAVASTLQAHCGGQVTRGLLDTASERVASLSD